MPGQAHGCPAQFLLVVAHGIDSICVQGLATHLDTKGCNAVPCNYTVFQSVLNHLPWSAFDKLVDTHQTDALSRSFSSRDQLIALLFAQFSGASSLREVEAVMESHQGRLRGFGVKAPKRSTFADANRERDPRVFSGLLEVMLLGCPRSFRRKMDGAVRLIDSTSLRLAGRGAQWARFSASVFGAKTHVVLDPDHKRPVYHAVTAANVNDITAAKAMPIEKGATYVFDLGYYDFGWWAQLDAAGCRFVTRLKTNTPLEEIIRLPVPAGSNILSDRIGFLPERQAKNRKNPFAHAVREIVVQTETGKSLRIVSNDLDGDAQEIADLYKRRWEIELFFRLLKQALKVAKFLGRSENAVRIQIAVALIAYLLLRTLHENTQPVYSFLELVRLLRANLMHNKDVTKMRPPKPSRRLDSRRRNLDSIAA